MGSSAGRSPDDDEDQYGYVTADDEDGDDADGDGDGDADDTADTVRRLRCGSQDQSTGTWGWSSSFKWMLFDPNQWRSSLYDGTHILSQILTVRTAGFVDRSFSQPPNTQGLHKLRR